MKASPYTVWLFVAVVVAVLGSLVVAGSMDGWLAGGGLLLLVASYGLVAGLWPAWLLLTAVAAGDVVVALSRWPAPWTLLVNAVLLILLLAGPTRRHVTRWRPLPRG